jgi:2,3,4,5-tetrahydropyridine-2-carboxylate N-succinyltransferase
VAEKVDGAWRVNAWVKEAILLYFAMRPLEPMEAGDLSFYDKVPVKRDLAGRGSAWCRPASRATAPSWSPGAC